MLDIMIPTCRQEVDDLLNAINLHTRLPHRVFASCTITSAAANRNICLNQMQHDIGIMLDDDICGIYPGWEWDLIAPLCEDPNVIMVSARLMNVDGSVGQTCSRTHDLTTPRIVIQPGTHSILPTAALAFRRTNIFFDERYIGSGFEDSDWCFEHRKRYPNALFIQSNECKLIHLNEMKNQKGAYWLHNKELFERKWLRVND